MFNDNSYSYLGQLTECGGQWDPIYGTETSLFWDQDYPQTELKTEPDIVEDCRHSGVHDEKLLDLAKTAEETGSLMPLLKEELRIKIQAKRLAAGQAELDIVETKPNINQLTEDDIRRRENRKAQNRRAAKRYRLKQRDLSSKDKQEKSRLENENAALLAQVKQLRVDKQRLLTLLEEHQLQCLTPREAEVPNWQGDSMFFFN